MALIKCPECGKDVSDTTSRCIHCGYSLTKPRLAEYKAEEGKENLTTVSINDGYDVMIVDYVGNKSRVVSSLAHILNCSTSEARAHLESAPAYLFTDVDESDGQAICRLLQNAGIRAGLYDPDGNCTYYQPINYNQSANVDYTTINNAPILDILPQLLFASSLRRMTSRALSPYPRKVVVQRRGNTRIRPNIKGSKR